MQIKSGITTIHAELTEVKQLPPPDCRRPEPPEMELSEECGEPKVARKEDVAEGEEPKKETEAKAVGASVEDAEKAKDCEAIVEKEGAGDGEDVEAAPVEDVEMEPVDEAGMPIETGTEGESTEPEEALNPTITEASSTN